MFTLINKRPWPSGKGVIKQRVLGGWLKGQAKAVLTLANGTCARFKF